MWMRHGISDNFSNSSGAFRHIHQFATTSLVTACVTYQVESYQSDICCDIWLCRPYWQPCWTNNHCSFNRLSNRVVQPVVKPGCTTGLTTGCIHDTAGRQTGCQTGLTTGWMFLYTIQPVVSCIQTFTRLSNRFEITGLTTGCIV